MKTEIIKDYYIKGSPHQIPEIMHQEVFQIKNKIIYVRAFDIIYGEEKIKRIFLTKPVKLDSTTNIESLFIGVFIEELTGKMAKSPKPTTKKSNSKKRKVDETARKEAAKSLFTDLGL